LFGAGSWDAVPTIPPELMLAPRWFPVHLSKISYWARTVVVPLAKLQIDRLGQAAAALRDAGHDASVLSMGMSGDYEVAVEEGATLVRLGTVLFGARPA